MNEEIQRLMASQFHEANGWGMLSVLLDNESGEVRFEAKAWLAGRRKCITTADYREAKTAYEGYWARAK